jgi:DNA-binding transcriptional LysR family regulator
LNTLPTLSTNDGDAEVEWPLENRDKQSMMFRHEPMMSCSDFAAVRTAASQGLGVAFLPEHFCHRALEKGSWCKCSHSGAACRGLFTWYLPRVRGCRLRSEP